MRDELYPHQRQAIAAVWDAMRAGKKNVLLYAPTGAGKTHIAARVAELMEQHEKRTAFVVDRVSLIDQTSASFDAQGIDHGVIQADHYRFRPALPVQVCSAQTLARRRWPEAQLVVVDECHTITKTVKDRIDPRDTFALGLTATPFTPGLDKLYDAVVSVATTNWLIEIGKLSPFRIFSCVEPDMNGVKVHAGEFDRKETEKRALEVVGDVVAEYIKHGEGRKFICSAVDTAHVYELQRQFLAAGITCGTYTYKDLDDDRADTLIEFKKPSSSLRGLITVTAASKGFDCPDIGCVIMARPLRKSLAEHIQFFGRGLRTAPGKVDCIVLDHSGNSARFWQEWNDVFEHGVSELQPRKKREAKKPPKDAEAELVKCPNCRHMHKARPTCPNCGHEYPKRAVVAHVPGTLKELVATGDQSLLRRQLWPQVVSFVLEGTEDVALAQRKAQAIYHELTGEFAKARVETTTPVAPTQELRNKIKANRIRWARSRQTEARP